MTGEISLKGRAMEIGGLKEKSMAAYKSGCNTVIIPQKNLKDLDEISQEVKETVEFIAVSEFDEIIPIALDEPIGYNNRKNIAINNKKVHRPVVSQ